MTYGCRCTAALASILLLLSLAPLAFGAEQPAPVPGSDETRLKGDIAAARAAVAATPADAGAQSRLGTLLLRAGAYDEALRVFNEALRINPRSSEARVGTGAALAGKGELEKAEQVLREALQSPDPVRAHYELGRLYERKGDFGRALAEFKEGIRKFQQGRH